MNIWFAIIAIAIISITLSVISLIRLENKSHVKDAKKELFKGRVVFQNSSIEEKE